jgi:hypothetical protein
MSDLLTPIEIWNEFKIGGSKDNLRVLLHLWRTKGCRAFKGKKLWAKKSPDGTTFRYRRQDIATIAAVPPPRDSFVDNKLTWLSIWAALDFLSELHCPCCPATLYDWRDNGVPFWDGKLRTRQELTRAEGKGGFQDSWYFCKEDLQEIATVKTMGQSGSPSNGVWPTFSEAKESFGFGREYLKAKVKAKKIRSKKEARILADGLVRRKRVFDPKGLKRLFDELANYPIRGTDPDWVTFSEAAESVGRTVRTIHNWAKFGCTFLPGARRLTVTEKMVDFGHQAKITDVCSRSDLKIILQRIPERDAPHVVNGEVYLPIGLMARKAKTTRYKIYSWIKRRWVRSERVDRPGRNRGQDSLFVHQGDVVARVNSQAISLEPLNATNVPGPSPPETQPEAHRRGRVRDPETERVYRFCYEAYTSGAKLSKKLREAQRRFGARAPKEKAHLRLFAKRYAKRYVLPLDRRSQNQRKTPRK